MEEVDYAEAARRLGWKVEATKTCPHYSQGIYVIGPECSYIPGHNDLYALVGHKLLMLAVLESQDGTIHIAGSKAQFSLYRTVKHCSAWMPVNDLPAAVCAAFLKGGA